MFPPAVFPEASDPMSQTTPSPSRLQQALDAHRAGRHGDAEALYLDCIRQEPASRFDAMVCLAFLCEQMNRLDEALKLYDLMIQANPGYGRSFSRRSLIMLRRAWGSPPAPKAGTGEAAGRIGGRIGMSGLGEMGRFGNQLLQYAFLRLYAERHTLSAEAPDWMGRDLFDLDDPLPRGPLPVLEETEADLWGMLAGTLPAQADRDLKGYFCGHSAGFAPFRDRFRSLFAPGRNASTALAPAMERLGGPPGGTLVALHLRRGDFGKDQFWIAPADWYLSWLETLWPTLAAPRLYIASDDPETLKSFGKYSPLCAADLGPAIPGAEFLIDHMALRTADRLAISNSTFSFTAAMLNERAPAGGFVRPERDARALVPFYPWNAPVLL